MTLIYPFRCWNHLTPYEFGSPLAYHLSSSSTREPGVVSRDILYQVGDGPLYVSHALGATCAQECGQTVLQVL